MTDIVEKLREASEQLMQPGMPYETEQRTIGGIPYTCYKHTPATLKELVDAGREHGDNPFLVYEGERYSFNEFYREVDAIGYQLVHHFGIQKGDRVAIAMRNYPEWMTAYSAVISLGAIVVPLNSWGQKAELEYGLTDAGASVVFCDEQRYGYIADELGRLDIRAVVARAEQPSLGENAEHYQDFITGGLGQSIPAFECDPEDPVMIMYTSGTTGRPKGALSCHRAVIQAIINFEYHAAVSAMANMDTIEKMLDSGYPSTSLLAVPLFHVSGCYAQFLLSLRGGRRIVMMYKWDPGKALKLVEEEGITALSGAPSMVLDVLEHPDFDKTDTRSLFSVVGAGAATPPKFKRLVYEKVEHPYSGGGYGMTETNATCSNFTGKAYPYKPRSSGTLSPIVEFKTVDENGNDLPRGEQGEIWLRSPTNVTEYWNKPEANAEAFHEGWYATGDIGYIDDEDFVFIVDRAKDMVIRGGENIYSAEVEGCIMEIPAVQEVAAFGVPHESLGEELAVALTLKPGQNIDETSIREHVRANLAGFKVPAYVWIRDEELPHNPSGKVLKKQLQKEFLESHDR